jgi:hypothetical protein
MGHGRGLWHPSSCLSHVSFGMRGMLFSATRAKVPSIIVGNIKGEIKNCRKAGRDLIIGE